MNADIQPGVDTIDVAIGTGAQTITPLSILPAIVHSVVIDGTSQPGFAGRPLINLSGVSISGNGLTIAANNSTIKGLVIHQFNGNGVDIAGSGDLLQGNYIGTDATGTIFMGNGRAYSDVKIDGTSNTVGRTTPAARNLISGNGPSGTGVTIKGAGNLVEGNYIGTDVSGTKALANGWGVLVSAPSNTLGGAAPGAGNLISGNSSNVGISSSLTLVQGNYIGTDLTGTQAASQCDVIGRNAGHLWLIEHHRRDDGGGPQSHRARDWHEGDRQSGGGKLHGH